jgi:hypothetical protein
LFGLVGAGAVALVAGFFSSTFLTGAATVFLSSTFLTGATVLLGAVVPLPVGAGAVFPVALTGAFSTLTSSCLASAYFDLNLEINLW